MSDRLQASYSKRFEYLIAPFLPFSTYVASPRPGPLGKEGEMMENPDSMRPREPSTGAEWREAVDAAYAAVLIDAAVGLGLLGDGPRVDMVRCRRLILLGGEMGFSPRRDPVVQIVVGLIEEPRPGFARRFAERLYDQHRPAGLKGVEDQ